MRTRLSPRRNLASLLATTLMIGATGLVLVPATASAATSGTAYVTNNGSNTLTPINLATNTPGTPIPAGSGPRGVAVTPDGATAYVVDGGTNSVLPINLATRTPRNPDSGRYQPIRHRHHPGRHDRLRRQQRK